MVYSLEKFRHYLLGVPFKFFTKHFYLQYLIKKLVLEGRICGWVLLFQEFSFQVVVNPNHLNVGPNHLSRLESGEYGGFDDDQLPNEHLFRVEEVLDNFEDISLFLATGKFPNDYKTTEKLHMVV